MRMWAIIFVVAIIGIIAAVWYVINRITRFRFIDYIEDKTIYKNKPRTTGKGADFGLPPKNKGEEDNNNNTKKKVKKSWLRRLIAVLLFIVVLAILTICFSYVEAFVILLHLAVIWLLCELIVLILRAFNIDLTHLKVYVAGIGAVSITIIYMVIAYILGSFVYITNYEIDTGKNIEPVRIVQIADSHLGVSMNTDTFPREVEKIKSLNPDMVLITGDYVDDNSSLEQLEECTKALSTINCKYGVFYSFGNHDKGMINNNNRGYDANKLVEILEANNVKVLEDEIVNLDNQYLLIGRADKSNRDRIPIQQLVDTIDPNEFANEYSIVMDHQPNDYDAEAAAKVDLVLSGHTHGGQFLPINRIGEIVGANDYTYGHKTIDKTDFIVTSGIACWAMRFKTGTKSEIVVIDVK